MNTRERLIETAAELFAQLGFRGASVRAICNRAGANPGAISYHFAGKRQLYRACLRWAVERVSQAARAPLAAPDAPFDQMLQQATLRIHNHLEGNTVAARLLVRDLAEGGDAAAEALAPLLRSASDALLSATALADEPGAESRVRLLLLAVAAPLLLVTVAWPALQRPLALPPGAREQTLRELVRSAIAGVSLSPR